MGDIEGVIQSLSSKAAPVKILPPPASLLLRLGLVIALYAAIVVSFMGVREDLGVQLARAPFLLELVLLAALTITSLRATIYLVYPDQYQKKHTGVWPIASACSFSALLVAEMLLPVDARAVIPANYTEGLECTLCISGVAIIPSALLFALLRRGANAHPWKAGAYAVLAATGTGCMMLRLAEANDSLTHLITWHYLPTLVFSALGALLGKVLLKW